MMCALAPCDDVCTGLIVMMCALAPCDDVCTGLIVRMCRFIQCHKKFERGKAYNQYPLKHPLLTVVGGGVLGQCVCVCVCVCVYIQYVYVYT